MGTNWHMQINNYYLPGSTMEEEHEEQFDNATSGASETYPRQCSALRKNDNVMIKGRPCKIVEMSTSKTGKHGHAKVHLVGMDLFNNKKLEDICPSTHNMEVPNVTRTDYQVVNVNDDGYLSLMDDNGACREDLKVADSALSKEVETRSNNDETFSVTVLKACGEEMVISLKKFDSSK